MQLISDILNGVTIGQTVAPVSSSATANGSAVDCQNADVRTHVIIDTGVVTGAYIYTVQMQSSPDNSTWTNEPQAGALSANVTAAGIVLLSYQRSDRYVRAVLTKVSGTSAIVGIHVLSQKKFEPAGSGADKSPST